MRNHSTRSPGDYEVSSSDMIWLQFLDSFHDRSRSEEPRILCFGIPEGLFHAKGQNVTWLVAHVGGVKMFYQNLLGTQHDTSRQKSKESPAQLCSWNCTMWGTNYNDTSFSGTMMLAHGTHYPNTMYAEWNSSPIINSPWHKLGFRTLTIAFFLLCAATMPKHIIQNVTHRIPTPPVQISTPTPALCSDAHGTKAIFNRFEVDLGWFGSKSKWISCDS